ncbi:MAG: pseudouridine synthase, partial [Bacteroidota bacterium]
MPLQILYEDRWLLAINKPTGLVVEANPFEKQSIEAEAQKYVGAQTNKPFIGIIHRLDRGTSGVLLLAKRKQALKDLNRQFEAKTIQKTYMALTHSAPAAPEGELRHWLFKDQEQKRAVLFAQKRPRTTRVHLSYRTMPHEGEHVLLEVQP